MNLVDLARTGVEAAVTEVRERARREPAEVTSVELVGLVPRRELERCSAGFREWAGLPGDVAVEERIGRGPRTLPGDPDPAAASGSDLFHGARLSPLASALDRPCEGGRPSGLGSAPG